MTYFVKCLNFFKRDISFNEEKKLLITCFLNHLILLKTASYILAGFSLSYLKRVKAKKSITIILLPIFLTACEIGSYTPGTFHKLKSRSLSFANPELRTCVFDPSSSIVHFPMHHIPTPEINQGIQNQEVQEAIYSQFQLLHTLLYYQRSERPLIVFDEHIGSEKKSSEWYNSLLTGQGTQTFTSITGVKFDLNERMRTARHLFPSFPSHYEYLSPAQKEFLYYTGASLTLYLLGELPEIWPVISSEEWELVKNRLLFNDQLLKTGNDYWIYDFREQALKRQVLNSFQRNALIFIAYGANHDFSDEFLGYPFQSGHHFCLNWKKNLVLQQN